MSVMCEDGSMKIHRNIKGICLRRNGPGVLFSLPHGTVSWNLLRPSKNYILGHDPVHMHKYIFKTKVFKSIVRLIVLALTCKKLGFCHSHSYNKKKMNILKISDFSSTHRRTKLAEQTTISKPGMKGKSSECLPRAAYLEQKSLEPETAGNI